jgi:chromosome segregation ATPase
VRARAALQRGAQRTHAPAPQLSTLNSSTAQQSEEHSVLLASHAELGAKLEGCLADLSAANAQIGELRQQTDAMSASATAAASAHKRELAARASLEENNVALAAELMQGEAAVVALHTQQLSVFESLAAERTALVQRNSELASKMAEDHTALERMKAEAAAALEAVARENEELSARNAALSAEMEAMAGTEAAALAISLAEARAALVLAEGRCKELAARNTSLSVQADAALAAAAEHRRLTESNSQLANEAAMLQTRLAQISRGLDSVGPSDFVSGPPSDADDASEVAFSDLASNISEAPGLTEASRAANKARSAQNKAKFDAIKAERNAFKAEARKAAKELERMRAEVAKVEELKKQLSTLQDSMFM